MLHGSRGQNAFKTASSRGTAAEIREVMNAQGVCRSSQPVAACREEAAQQAALAEFLDPRRPPALSIASEPFQDSRKSDEIAA
jgi:hypothetical protein